MVKKKSTEKPKKSKKPEKKKVTSEEYEKKVLELEKQGLTADKIGEALRAEGIHPAEQNKKISKILKEKGNYIDPTLHSTEQKLSGIKAHFEKNKQDKRAMRERERIASKLRKIKKYFSSR